MPGPLDGIRILDCTSVVEHPTEGTIRMPDIPPRFSKTPPAIVRLQPRLGEHSVEVLRKAGLSAAEIDAMLASGATAQPGS